jgi:hypothetical protein
MVKSVFFCNAERKYLISSMNLTAMPCGGTSNSEGRYRVFFLSVRVPGLPVEA